MSCYRLVTYTEFVMTSNLKNNLTLMIVCFVLECTQIKEWYHDCPKKFPKNILKLTPLTISVLNYVSLMPINPYLCHINSLFSVKFPKVRL